MVAGDAGQPAHALQQVGKMAQQVLVGLGGGVGHVGEQPEGRHIGEEVSRVVSATGTTAPAASASSGRVRGSSRVREKSLVVPAGM